MKKIQQPGEDSSSSCLCSVRQFAVSSWLEPFFFFLNTCLCSPRVVTLGLYSIFGQSCREYAENDHEILPAAVCKHTQGTRRFARWHWPTCLWQRLLLGKKGGGKETGRQRRKQRGFTALKRVGIPPELFPHLAGSCENNCLAFTLSLCRWSPSYESALRAASGGESGGLELLSTGNISISLLSHAVLRVDKLLRVALIFSTFTFLHYFQEYKLTFACNVSCRVYLTKMPCWCLELREPWLLSQLVTCLHLLSPPGLLHISHRALAAATSTFSPPPSGPACRHHDIGAGK